MKIADKIIANQNREKMLSYAIKTIAIAENKTIETVIEEIAETEKEKQNAKKCCSIY